MDLPQAVQDFIDKLQCGRCGLPTGLGLSTRVTPEDHDKYLLVLKCLRCGMTGWVRLEASATHLDAASVPVEPSGSEITSDETIDLHEALKSDDWLAQLTRPKS
jgi:ribosomal protein S27AE